MHDGLPGGGVMQAEGIWAHVWRLRCWYRLKCEVIRNLYALSRIQVVGGSGGGEMAIGPPLASPPSPPLLRLRRRPFFGDETEVVGRAELG